MQLARANSSIASVIPLSTVPHDFPLDWSLFYAANWSGRQNAHIERPDRPVQTFIVEFAERFELGDFFHRDLDPALNQNLTVIGSPAQARSEIVFSAGRRIVEA